MVVHEGVEEKPDCEDFERREGEDEDDEGLGMESVGRDRISQIQDADEEEGTVEPERDASFQNDGQGSWRLNGDMRIKGKDSPFVVFSSNFDSGNCNLVKYIEPWNFELTTAHDCSGTEYQTHSKTWFYFCVRGVPKNQRVKLIIRDLNNQKALFNHGHKPVVRRGHRGRWERLSGSVGLSGITKTSCSISFSHKFLGEANEPVYFAFSYPHSYTEMLKKVIRIEKSLKTQEEKAVMLSETGKRRKRGRKAIHFRKDCLALSLQGREIVLLTVTNYRVGEDPAASMECVSELKQQHHYMFPTQFLSKKKPIDYPHKPIIFVSARVHPGETPASFSFNGFLDFILDATDPRASRLRDNFVFKLVPMINPDGVALGFYRSNTLGLNLNRCYDCPLPSQAPGPAAIKTLLSHYAKRLYLYIDMHGHASKRGCFLYGNHFTDMEKQVENVTYSRLVALNTPYLDTNGCDFSQKNMVQKDKRDQSVSKEGSGRVCIFKTTGVLRCYTLECNYNCGKVINDTPPVTLENGKSRQIRRKPGRLGSRTSGRETKGSTGASSSRTPSPPRQFPPGLLPGALQYGPDQWRDVGKACAISILDANASNPWSRVEQSPYRSLEGIRLYTQSCIRKKKEKRASALAKRKSRKIRERAAASNHPGLLPTLPSLSSLN